MSEASAGSQSRDERRDGKLGEPGGHGRPSTQDGAEHGPAIRANSAVLRIRTGPLAGPILTRVVAMMLTRAACPVNRLDDAMVVCDALAAHAGDHAEDGMVQFRILTRADSLQLRVGALTAGGAHRLAAATAVPGVGEVLTPIAEVSVEASLSGDGEELVLDLAFAGQV